MTPNLLNQGAYSDNGSGRQIPVEGRGVVAYEVEVFDFDLRHELSRRSSVTRNIGRKVDVYD